MTIGVPKTARLQSQKQNVNREKLHHAQQPHRCFATSAFNNPHSHYANKQNMDANQGQSSPGTASNVGNPVSSSPESNKINQSRATDARTGSPDTASVQTPVSNPKGAATGQQGEDSSTQQAFKQDPNAPASEKRKNVEEKGQRPLDPADK
ncbi:hypothetical protein D6D20_04033 [Aureobasidium pullulans]|uniref:HAD-like protein n=1 Tax=Aureobasidium pullulans TaxID=5580 RepID=A0A4S8ZC50_AURPU|nr:hypothetical protein D6D20_04033 [Aureobasidium pullulans]